jgi:hypothetical protein
MDKRDGSRDSRTPLSARLGRLTRPPFHSSLACLQTDTDLSSFIVGEENAGLFKGFLYLEDGGEVSFHDSLVLFDALQSRQPNPGRPGKLVLAPA